MPRAGCAVILVVSVCLGESLPVRKRVVLHEQLRGAAMARDGRLFTWGDTLTVRDPSLGNARVLAKGSFGEGGCLVDLDGDGEEEFVGKEGDGLGRLIWRKPPHWVPVVMEEQTDTHECLEATLFGRKGVLAIHRHMQVRFYESSREGHGWNVREIYSIYTPSQQAGLSVYDVDQDGRLDILCGNYWIRSPERFDLPWHIFAINTWFEMPQSAMLAHAWGGDQLFVAQAHNSPSRVAIFTKPDDVRQLWTEKRLEGNFVRMHAVARVNGRIVFAENNGAASRLFEVRNHVPFQIAEGQDTLKLFVAPGGLISVGPHAITLWDYRRK